MTVERSVTFVPKEIDIRIGNVPVEGKIEDLLEEVDEHTQPISPEIKCSAKNPDRPATPQAEEASNNKTPEPSEHVQPEIVAEEDTGGRGKRIRKESAYVRRIQEGEGSASGRKGSSVIPKGIQLPPVVPEEVTENAEVAEEDWAMATVMEAAECLNPTYEEAKRHSDWPKWQDAIKAELTSLEKNSTWSVVERPKGANIVDCKWVLRIKKNAASEIEKYKAQLVARSFTQIYGIDYYEMYAPVARLASFRLLIATVGP